MTPGTRVGPYELTALLGAGGMGEVYRAHDSRLGRTVAVKILPPEAATASRLRRFEQEARAASALNHPNILTIHDVGREGDIAYVAMEWIEGQTLRSVLSGPRLPIRRIVELAIQIAEGLAKAHAAGIVHRDIKPENVMVSDDGFVKIVDFGLATLVTGVPGQDAAAEGDKTRTVSGVAGTVGYMSPEQASGHPVDHRSDQFALGVMLYEMATRTRPFERATVPQSLVATIEAEPAPVDARNRDVPPHLAEVVKRCLEKAPGDRYESTRDLARDLRRTLDESPAVNTVGTPPRSARRRWAALGAAVVVLAVAVAASYWRSTPSATAPAELPLVAVRTFQSRSADQTQTHVATGLSEQIHGQLSRLSGLRLLNREAIARSTDGEASRLARDLGVRGVVEGSVLVDGPRVRIEARLIDPAQRILWSTSYDRDRGALLTVSSDVARQVGRTLRVPLTLDELQGLDRRPTQSVDAYLLYGQWLNVRGDWSDRASHYASFEPLRKALALDPTFAAAQSALAYQLAFMAQLYDDNDSLLSHSVANAEEALRHDVRSSEAHEAIAVVHAVRGHAGQARLSFQRGIAVDPNAATIMNNLSMLDVTVGRFATSLEWAWRGFERSGRRAVDYYHVGAPLACLRDDDVTWRWLLDGERRFPASPRIQQLLALQEVLTGRPADAISRAKRSIETGPPDNIEAVMALSEIAYLVESPDLEALTAPLMRESAGTASLWVGETARVRYAYALSKSGNARRAAGLLDDAERAAQKRIDAGDEMPIWRTELGAIAAIRGRAAAALDWLGRAYDAGSREYGLLERDPAFAALRAHPRFLALVDSMRRDVAAQRQAAREKGLLDLDSLLQVGRTDTAPRQ